MMIFPGLRAVLGKRAFDRLARAYLAECPSQSFTLRDLGSLLEDWLRRNPRYAGTRHALALDMVRLEWAHIEAFDSVAEKVLGPEDLLELGPNFRAGLQPYIRLLALDYPIDSLRIQVNRATDEHGAASNAALKQKYRSLSQRVTRLKRERIYLAVHRLNFTVYYKEDRCRGVQSAQRPSRRTALRQGDTDRLQGQSRCERRATVDARTMVCRLGRGGLAVPARASRQEKGGKNFAMMIQLIEEILSAIDSHLVEPRIPISARGTAVLGVAVHASWLGQAA